jgi:hypothetical protein
VPDRPAPGTGPYLHFQCGSPVLEYRNSSSDDRSCMEFRVEV